MLDGVGAEFMQGKADGLGRLRGQHDFGTGYGQTGPPSFSKQRKLVDRKIMEQGPPPVFLDEQIVGSGKPLQSMRKHRCELFERPCGAHCLPSDRLHHSEQVLRSMRHFSHQQLDMLLSFLALANVHDNVEDAMRFPVGSARYHSAAT